MKKLIVCQTAFQIITALYIREQFVKKDDQMDIIITNTFNGYDEISKRIIKKNIFSSVIIADVKDLVIANGIKKNIFKLYNILFFGKKVKQIWKNDIPLYDELYCWNYDSFTASIRSYLELRKHHVKMFIYDEGYITYMPIDQVIPKRGFMKLIELRNKLCGIGNITRENIDGMLLFEPEFLTFKPNCPITIIDRSVINNKDFKKNISYIFNVNDVLDRYDRKYILFEEAMLANCSNVNDFEIFKDIIDFVGKENVIVKLHPRTKEDRFSNLGVKVLGSDGVPWEAIVLAGDFSDKVLITIGSGSITNCRMLFGSSVESYMLFKIIKPNLPQFDEKYNELWDKIGKPCGSAGLHIPNDIDEFYNLLKGDGE